jgi:hypothetical protein
MRFVRTILLLPTGVVWSSIGQSADAIGAERVSFCRRQFILVSSQLTSLFAFPVVYDAKNEPGEGVLMLQRKNVFFSCNWPGLGSTLFICPANPRGRNESWQPAEPGRRLSARTVTQKTGDRPGTFAPEDSRSKIPSNVKADVFMVW